MGHLSKEIETMKKNLTEIVELKNIVTEIKITRYGLNSRFEMLGELLNLKSIEIIQSEEQIEKLSKKNEQSFRGLWDKKNCTNIPIMGGPEKGRKRKGQKNQEWLRF